MKNIRHMFGNGSFVFSWLPEYTSNRCCVFVNFKSMATRF